MKPRLVAATILVSLLTIPHGARAQAVLQRFVLIAGANSGGADRPVLRYAVSDADRFARVMRDLGGVSSPDALVLKEPKVRSLVEALNWLNQRVAEARRTAGPGKSRTEILVYYSGHADEKGLLLGDDRYSYQSLRDRLDEIPADVRIAVLDACASGAFTRLKGGKVHKPFMVDQATDMQGHAFLTSSAETEAAQESDHLGASYFTHYLISGLRGAADVNTDGKISLNEAYQFAFQETLGRTVNSQGGAQHPSYDIKLSGTGDVTITDVRQTTATLALAASLEGRIFVRNARQELVVELYKAQGRTVELGLEPGTYEVRMERPAEAWLAKSQVSGGQRLELGLDQFSPTEPAARRWHTNLCPRRTQSDRTADRDGACQQLVNTDAQCPCGGGKRRFPCGTAVHPLRARGPCHHVRGGCPPEQFLIRIGDWCFLRIKGNRDASGRHSLESHERPA